MPGQARYQSLALGELEAAARLGVAVLLALHHAGVTGEKSARLQHWSKAGLVGNQRARNAVPHRSGLSGKATARNRDDDVELAIAHLHGMVDALG